MAEHLIEIVDPTAERECKRVMLATRKHRQLKHKRVGLLDNSKPNADKFLGYIGELLQARYEGLEIVFKRKMSRTEADCTKDLIDHCDVVITAFAD